MYYIGIIYGNKSTTDGKPQILFSDVPHFGSVAHLFDSIPSGLNLGRKSTTDGKTPILTPLGVELW